jgi:hypothetical protein
MRRYFSLLYYRPYRELRERTFPSLFHMTRDGMVHLELAPLLSTAGFEYQGALLNVPVMVQRDNPTSVTRRDQVFRAGDLIVLGTRPPLREEGRRQIDRSMLEIEQLLLKKVDTVFDVCSRTRVEVKQSVAVPDEYRALSFQEFNGGRVKRRNSGAEKPFTVGYSVWFPAASRSQWSAWVVFGLGGAESALFAYLLRTQFASVVHKTLAEGSPRLLMVRFAQPQQIPFPSMTYASAELQARIVADCDVGHN